MNIQSRLMKVKKISILLLVVFVSVIANASDAFKLSKTSQTSRILVNRDFAVSEVFKPFVSDIQITGLSITGRVEKKNNNYLVRVILKDKKGASHLVLESYEMKNSADSFTLEDYCEETALLNNIVPEEISVIVKNAIVTIQSIDYALPTVKSMMSQAAFKQKNENIRKQQTNNIVERINSYNIAHKKLWLAGNTVLSNKDYEVRKRILGLADSCSTGGYEYYASGIFEAGEPDTARVQTRESSYIDHFDWRDRHGRNWITGVRDQYESNYCFAFAPIACLEALSQLYYNDLSSIPDIDLSEMNVARCSNAGLNGGDPYVVGGFSNIAAAYIASEGVCDEASYPYVAGTGYSCAINQITPSLMVKPYTYTSINKTNDDYIKGALINKGPLISGYKPSDGDYGHAMAIVGYGTIHEGDTIREYNGSYLNAPSTIAWDDNRVGKTYWIFKNSRGGESEAYLGGYQYILFNNYNHMRDVYAFITPVSLTEGGVARTTSDIICEDRDGDGYYFWGIGPKPSHCPASAPDEPDGDDSNAIYGPLDIYGNLTINPVNPEITPADVTISDATVFSSNQTLNYGIEIANGGTLTITGTVSFSDNAFIRVGQNGTLVVDGGTLNYAKIATMIGGNVSIINNGTINKANGQSFNIPKNATMNIQYGNVN